MRKFVWLIAIMAIMFTGSLFMAGCSKKSEQQEDTSAIADIEFEKGLELASRGDFEQGLIHFQEALKNNDKHYRAWCGLGSASRELKRYDEAIEYSLKAIELKPDYVVCYDNLGLAYAYKGAYPEAIKSFEKAIELDPKYADAHFNLGLLYYEKLDKPDLAIASFEEFVKLSDKTEKVAQARQLIEELKSEDEK